MNETSTQRHAWPRSRADRVADGRHAPPLVLEQAGSVRPGAGKAWGLIGLVILTAVTSLVVATISAWLVPVYMAAMVLIFAAPRSPRPADEATTPREAPPAPPEDAAPPRADGVEGGIVGEAPEVVVDPPAPPEAVEPTPAKPRKRRAKAKRGKAAQAAEALASEPTWIRVGPGKFVRADVQAAPADTDADAPAPSTSDPEAGAPTEAQTTTLTAADLRIESDATPAADVEPDAAAEAAESTTHEDATPASPHEAEPSEVISPASFISDEAEPMESDEGYGIAPSALAGAFDEGYGIAPSALVETWAPEALPDAVADEAPRPDAEPTEAEWIAEDEDRSEAQIEVVDEAEVESPVDEIEAEAPADEPEDDPEARPAPAAPAATAASPTPRRLPPGRTTPPAKGAGRTHGPSVGLARLVSRSLGGRLAPPRPPRRRGADARPARSGRIDVVRVRVAQRGRRRSDPTGGRHHPRSPPGRA
ncbi:hypothetical protein [Paludisphaera sp.]|uniref:hypothetical protein n=1 Tax=Paludisphaera sp. TaxID=2017432 RepID=UPI00301D1AF5